MKKIDLQLAVGFFMLIGIFSLAYLSIRLGKLETMSGGSYTVHADFINAAGVKEGTVVEIAGIEVGKVVNLSLTKDYRASVTFAIKKSVAIQEDASASIRTKGLIGEKFVQISPGASDKLIPDGGKITETESVTDIEDLISRYIFGKVGEKEE
jgi:phospholipid/cholesterol/gamma-HCH transport system substrate-binding protein